jgi:8-oxo-dGTP pyrophosphatase MutT (NUDIX family)
MKSSLRDGGAESLLINWTNRVNSGPAKIISTTPLARVTRSGRTVASFIDTVIEFDGYRIPRCILLRGDSAIVVPLLRITDDQGLYSLMVEQLRPVDGKNTLEFVGGMVEACESPAQSAVREVREELGISIRENDLQSLFPEPIRVCTAMLDERAHFFAFEREVNRDFLKALDGKALGEHSDGEYIHVRVVTLEEAERQPIFSAQVGVFLSRRLLASKANRSAPQHPVS